MAGAGLAFPLVPRRRLLGLAFGAAHSARRGLGSDVAGSRPYQPGDDVNAIDWHASARLSSARDSDEFVVRARFADEAPRVVVLADRRPAMQLYPPALPWLRKAQALEVATRLVAASAYRARGLFGYLDLAAGEPFWNAPASEPQWRRLEEELPERPFTATAGNVADALEFLELARISLPRGSFVFVLSDFLASPPPERWLSALEHGWDVVPVVIQDPTWEQSFPDVGGVAIPVVDVERGKAGVMRLSRARARELRETHEQRLSELVDELTTLGTDPVVLGADNEEEMLEAFLSWGQQRLQYTHAWMLGA